MDQQRLALLKRKLEALSYDGELDTKSAPLAEKVRTPPARLPRMAEKWQGPPQLRFEFRAERADARPRYRDMPSILADAPLRRCPVSTRGSVLA